MNNDTNTGNEENGQVGNEGQDQVTGSATEGQQPEQSNEGADSTVGSSADETQLAGQPPRDNTQVPGATQPNNQPIPTESTPDLGEQLNQPTTTPEVNEPTAPEGGTPSPAEGQPTPEATASTAVPVTPDPAPTSEVAVAFSGVETKVVRVPAGSTVGDALKAGKIGASLMLRDANNQPIQKNTKITADMSITTVSQARGG